MGVITEMTARRSKVAKEAKKVSNLRENADDMKARMLESASAKLDTEYSKYENLRKLMESSDRREIDASAVTVRMLEAQKRYIDNSKQMYGEATITAGFQNLLPKLLDIVAVFFPEMIQTWIADAQPIDAMISGVYVLKPIYSDTADGVVAGDEIFKTKTTHASYASEYRYSSAITPSTESGHEGEFSYTYDAACLPLRAGSVVLFSTAADGTETIVAIDNGAGVLTGTATTGTINYQTGAIAGTTTATGPFTLKANVDTEVNVDNNRKVKLIIDNIPVKAEPFILQADYSVQSALAANAHLGITVGDQLADIMGGVLKRERDQRLTRLMLANTTPDAALQFSKTVPSGVSKSVHFADFNLMVDLARSDIQNTMTRGDVDFVVAGWEACNVISAIPGFVASDKRAPVGSYMFGTLDNGRVAVIKSFDIAKDQYMFGYKGYTTGDSAVIVADWIPLYTAPELQKPNMQNSQGVASFYAMHVNNTGYWKRSALTA